MTKYKDILVMREYAMTLKKYVIRVCTYKSIIFDAISLVEIFSIDDEQLQASLFIFRAKSFSNFCAYCIFSIF